MQELEQLESYIERSIDAFFIDLPDSDYQRGYLAALVNIYREVMGRDDERLAAALKLIARIGDVAGSA